MIVQQPYTVLWQYAGFELRHYPAHLLAQVTVNAGFQGAANAGFRHLHAYISGQDTAPSGPVPSRPDRPVLAVTAPLLLEPSPIPGAFSVGFVLPPDQTAWGVPVPDDPAVSIVPVPGRAGAATAFPGRWSEANFQHHLAALQSALSTEGFTALGSPRFARFDPPRRPWFRRRNEVIQDVEGPGD